MKVGYDSSSAHDYMVKQEKVLETNSKVDEEHITILHLNIALKS